MKKIDINNCWPEIWWIEEILWYDGIAYYENKDTWQHYSRAGYPIASDEICKYGRIYKVKLIRDGDGPFDYHYEVLSSRPDIDESEESVQEGK